MSKRMTQEELEKAKEVYKKILDLMVTEGLTYHQVDWIRGWMYVDIKNKAEGFLKSTSAKEVLFGD